MAADEATLAELQEEAEARGLPKYGTKAEIAGRIIEYDASDDPDSDSDSDVVEDVTVTASATVNAADAVPSVGATEVDEPKPVRAGGYIDRRDGNGWVIENAEHERPPPDPRDSPVDAGSAGLPGNPAMRTAVHDG